MAKKGFNIDEYRLVATRVSQFWLEHPSWSFTVSIHHVSDDTVLMEGIIKDEDGTVRANGFAEETRELLRFVGAHNAVEVCETSARGRALAAFGYLGSASGIAGKEEMEMATAIQNKLASVPIPEDLAEDIQYLFDLSKKRFPDAYEDMGWKDFWKRLQIKALKDRREIDADYIREKQEEISGTKASKEEKS